MKNHKRNLAVKTGGMLGSLLMGVGCSLSVAAADLYVPANYATIQAAVDAASSGDTIRIAAGVYEEQVFVARKNLKLLAEPGAVLKARPGLLETLLPIDPSAVNVRPVLGIALADDVVVKGLTVDGARLGDVNPGMIGVLFHGSSGRTELCTIRGFRGDPGLGSSTEGFAAGNFEYLGRPMQRVRVVNSVFENNWASIEAVGRLENETGPNVPRLTFFIQHNTITGVGPTDAGTQEGILIKPGATGEVKRNAISDHNSIGPAYTFSFGIDAQDFSGNLTPLQPVFYEGNTFLNNQEHIFASAANGHQFVNNSFRGSSTGTRPNGIAASGDNLRIVNNDFSDMPTGITLFGDDADFGTALGLTTNASLIANRFCDVTTPIDVEPLVTGVTEHGSKLCRDEHNENRN